MSNTEVPDLASLAHLTSAQLRIQWPRWFDQPPPAKLRKHFLAQALAYQMQVRTFGGLRASTRKRLYALAIGLKENSMTRLLPSPRLTPGTRLMREWRKETHEVIVEERGFAYRGRRYRSLSEIARTITGTRWSGPLFFGLKPSAQAKETCGDDE